MATAATACGDQSSSGGGSGGTTTTTRLLFVRHGKQVGSANRPLARDKWDPCLAQKGQRQAELLAAHLTASGLGNHEAKGVLCVSSPMRRALMTAAPSAAALGCPLVCNGSLYEYGCAGLERPGTTPALLQADWPGLHCVSFSASQHWDYVGGSAAETEAETRLRGARFLSWLDALLRGSGSPSHSPDGLPTPTTVIFYAHQTFLDLLLRMLVDGPGAAAGWGYSQGKQHRFAHTAVAELAPAEAGK